MASSRQKRWEEGDNAMKERKKNTGWQNDTEKLKRRDQVAVTWLRTGYSRPHTVKKNLRPRLPALHRKTHTRTSMGERRRRSKNAGRICEKDRIILRTIDTKTQIGTKKERTLSTKEMKWKEKFNRKIRLLTERSKRAIHVKVLRYTR
jgi:hypothetical protein